MKRTYSLSLLAPLVLVAILFASCKNSVNPVYKEVVEDILPEAVKDIAGIERLHERIDYSIAENWVSRPLEAAKPVDVFFIFPTIAGYRSNTELCAIDDTTIVAGAQSIRMVQASVFDESCNVFMPYYRQISMPKSGSDSDYTAITDYLSSFDTRDALDYYFTHLNHGRPFILAGHSQGASTLLALLENYMLKHPEVLGRMVAAYPIGFAVTRKWLKRTGFKFAEGSTDTGVIVSWNTEGPGNRGQDNFVLQDGAVCINPINWRRDDTYAPAKENLGSLDNMTGLITVPGIADARLDTIRGSVIVTAVDSAAYAIQGKGVLLFGPESYHLNDYSFFYNNLKKNIADRIKAFMEK